MYVTIPILYIPIYILVGIYGIGTHVHRHIYILDTDIYIYWILVHIWQIVSFRLYCDPVNIILSSRDV